MLQRRMLWREVDRARIVGTEDDQEVNRIYSGGIDSERIKESAKSVRLQLLWSAIARRRSKGRHRVVLMQ